LSKVKENIYNIHENGFMKRLFNIIKYYYLLSAMSITDPSNKDVAPTTESPVNDTPTTTASAKDVDVTTDVSSLVPPPIEDDDGDDEDEEGDDIEGDEENKEKVEEEDAEGDDIEGDHDDDDEKEINDLSDLEEISQNIKYALCATFGAAIGVLVSAITMKC